MGQQGKKAPCVSTGKSGISRVLRRRLAVTTILAVAPFLGYGRQSYAACVGPVGSPPTFTCSGAGDVAPIVQDEANVVTGAGFSVPTSGLSISGNGLIQFTDANASSITNTNGNGLDISSTGDNLPVLGGIKVSTNGTITGSDKGIKALNNGTGDIVIDLTGNAVVTGQGTTGPNGDGIYANSPIGRDITITTAVGTKVIGADEGIDVETQHGNIKIEANGYVKGANDGIAAVNHGGGLTITTGADSDITGGHFGIYAKSSGVTGPLTITAKGNVTGGNNFDGIYALATGSGLTVTTEVGSSIKGGDEGIDAVHLGPGDINITTGGEVIGEHDGVAAFNLSNGDNLSITVGAQSTVKADDSGVIATNLGQGNLTISVDGKVDAKDGDGIYAYNISGLYDFDGDTVNGKGIDLIVTTGAQSVVSGGSDGIDAENLGIGEINIKADGVVTGKDGDGIYATNASVESQDGTSISGHGTHLTITTGAQSVITGSYDGIGAVNLGEGNLTITADGHVTGTERYGIYAANVYANGVAYGDDERLHYAKGVDLTITTGAQSVVTGGAMGIYALNLGKGELKVTANGVVTGYDGDGIYAINDFTDVLGEGDSIISYGHGTNLIITAGAQSIITGSIHGIHGRNFGAGELNITANGRVTGGEDGIYAENFFADGYNPDTHVAYFAGGTALRVTTGPGSMVIGENDDGIEARQYGNGNLEITVNGQVTGKGEDEEGEGSGIEAHNFGYGEEITTSIKVGGAGIVEGKYSGIYAESGNGQAITITNGGLVRNLSAKSDYLAIATFGGPTHVINNANVVGTVFFNGEIGFDDWVENKGLWNMARGVSDFGGNDETGDVLDNTGALLVAVDASLGEKSFIENLEFFNNNAGGVVSLVDGQAVDKFYLNYKSDPIAYKGQGGMLAVDAILGPGPDGTSDELIIHGSTSGVTKVHVNVLDATGPNTVGIPVVEVDEGFTDVGHFVLDGPLNAGFYAWDIRFNDSENWHELYSTGPGAGSYEFAAGMTGLQDIWHQTTGTLLQRQADLRVLLQGTGVTPVADFAEPVSPTPVAKVTPGFWMKGVGAWLKRDDEENNIVLDRKQSIYGGLAGFDFGTEDVGDALMFGVFGGYLTSKLKFDETNTEWKYDGPTVGAYVTYIDHAFYVDATVKADFLDIKIDPEDIAPLSDDADTDGVSYGGRIDTGYKIGQELFFEPQASLAVARTEIDDVDIFGGDVKFDDETSVRGRLGLRVGSEQTGSDGTVYSADVIASVWQDFSGDNGVTVADPAAPSSFDVSDSPTETYGDVSLGFSLAAPEGWSGFLRGNYQFADDYDAYSANAGLRYAW